MRIKLPDWPSGGEGQQKKKFSYWKTLPPVPSGSGDH